MKLGKHFRKQLEFQIELLELEKKKIDVKIKILREQIKEYSKYPFSGVSPEIKGAKVVLK